MKRFSSEVHRFAPRSGPRQRKLPHVLIRLRNTSPYPNSTRSKPIRRGSASRRHKLARLYVKQTQAPAAPRWAETVTGKTNLTRELVTNEFAANSPVIEGTGLVFVRWRSTVAGFVL